MGTDSEQYSACLLPHILQQQGEGWNELESVVVFDGAFRYQSDVNIDMLPGAEDVGAEKVRMEENEAVRKEQEKNNWTNYSDLATLLFP